VLRSKGLDRIGPPAPHTAAPLEPQAQLPTAETLLAAT
jgi:hypothetical protein